MPLCEPSSRRDTPAPVAAIITPAPPARNLFTGARPGLVPRRHRVCLCVMYFRNFTLFATAAPPRRTQRNRRRRAQGGLGGAEYRTGITDAK